MPLLSLVSDLAASAALVLRQEARSVWVGEGRNVNLIKTTGDAPFVSPISNTYRWL